MAELRDNGGEVADTRQPDGTGGYVLPGLALAGLCALVRGFGALFVSLSADEGVVGLMSLDILSGRAPTVYWYGQQYMGTLENILSAPFIAVFGTNALAVRIPSVVGSALCVYLVYTCLARRVSRRAGLFAALLLIFSPPFFHDITLRARGGYGITLPLVAGALCIALSGKNRDPDRFSLVGADVPVRPDYNGQTRRVAPTFLFGLLAGVAFWTNPQTFEVSVPLALIIIFSGRIASSLAAAAGALLGAMPIIGYYIATGVLMRPPPVRPESSLSVLAALPRRTVAVFGAGEAAPFALRAAGVGVSLFLAAGVIGYLYTRLNKGGHRAFDALLAAPVLGSAVLAVQGHTWAPQRYFYLIYFACALVAAVGWAAISRRTAAAAVVAVVILVNSLGVGFHHLRDPFAAEYLSSAEYRAVEAHLEERGIDTVVTDYGADYALMYLTGLRIKALPVPLGGAWYTRYKAALDGALDAERFAVVLYDQPAHERLKDHMKPTVFAEFLAATGRTAEVTRIGRIHVFTGVSAMRGARDMGEYGRWALGRFERLRELLPIVNGPAHAAPRDE
ncbi:MAG: ArnT family glycosyltransferase [Planctomycetota bacterium]